MKITELIALLESGRYAFGDDTQVLLRTEAGEISDFGLSGTSRDGGRVVLYRKTQVQMGLDALIAKGVCGA